MRQPQFPGRAPSGLDREVRRIVFAKVAARIVEPEVVNYRWRNDLVESQQQLFGIAENTGVAVDVIAGTSDADGRCFRVTEVNLCAIADAVIQPQGLARFVLLD